MSEASGSYPRLRENRKVRHLCACSCLARRLSVAPYARLGAISVDIAPAQLGTFLKNELAKWTKVIDAGKVTPE